MLHHRTLLWQFFILCVCVCVCVCGVGRGGRQGGTRMGPPNTGIPLAQLWGRCRTLFPKAWRGASCMIEGGWKVPLAGTWRNHCAGICTEGSAKWKLATDKERKPRRQGRFSNEVMSVTGVVAQPKVSTALREVTREREMGKGIQTGRKARLSGRQPQSLVREEELEGGAKFSSQPRHWSAWWEGWACGFPDAETRTKLDQQNETMPCPVSHVVHLN